MIISITIRQITYHLKEHGIYKKTINTRIFQLPYKKITKPITANGMVLDPTERKLFHRAYKSELKRVQTTSNQAYQKTNLHKKKTKKESLGKVPHLQLQTKIL